MKRLLATSLLVTMMAASAAAEAEPVSVSGIGETREVDCHGEAATVSGIRNKVTLTGCSKVSVSGNDNHVTVTDACPTVEVMGNANSVAVDKARKISASGNNNTVTWRAPLDAGKKKPSISKHGNKNQVTQAKAPAGEALKPDEKPKNDVPPAGDK